MTTPYVTDEQFRDFARKESHGAETPQGDAPETFPGMPTDLAGFRHRWPALVQDNERLAKELEIERLRLAACGVCALSNTVKSVEARIPPEHPQYSASYGDVCRAVDAEIRYRVALREVDALLITGQYVAARARIRTALEV